jgi:hypothetical protein
MISPADQNKKDKNAQRFDYDGCQLLCVPRLSTGRAVPLNRSIIGFFKRLLAVPWNLYIKRWLKRKYYISIQSKGESSFQLAAKAFATFTPLKKGDLVKVRSMDEILETLDPFKELKGCAFLPEMYQYCGTEQVVFKSMERFIDERDYKPKKTRGIILLENVICNGTPLYGQCDRCCFLFWREEWLEKI